MPNLMCEAGTNEGDSLKYHANQQCGPRAEQTGGESCNGRDDERLAD